MTGIPQRDTAGGVVLGAEGKIILVNQGSNVWSFPKGGIEPDEDVLAAARREIAEETGITALTFLRKLGSYKRYRIGKGGIGEDRSVPESTRNLFLFKTDEREFKQGDEEVVEARWVSLEEAAEMLTHPKDRAFFESVMDVVREAIQ